MQLAGHYLLAAGLGAGLLAAAFKWPRQLILLSPPVILVVDPFVGNFIQREVPAVLLVRWAVGVFRGEWRATTSHLALATFAAWMVIAFWLDPMHLEKTLAPAEDLLTLLLGVAACAAVISIGVDQRSLLASGAITGVACVGIAVLARAAGGNQRISADGLNSNFLGIVLALGCVASVSGLSLSSPRSRWLWLVAAALAGIGLLLSESRSAAVAAIAGACVLAVSWRRSRLVYAGVVATVVVVSAVMLVGTGVESVVFGGRTSADFGFSNAIRVRAAYLAGSYAVGHPITGIGYGQFAAMAARDPRLGVYINTHDDYLRLAAEAGLPALLLFLVVCAIALRRSGDRETGARRAIISAYMVALLFANSLSSVPVTLLFWIWLGVGLGRQYEDEGLAVTSQLLRRPFRRLSTVISRQRQRSAQRSTSSQAGDLMPGDRLVAQIGTNLRAAPPISPG